MKNSYLEKFIRANQDMTKTTKIIYSILALIVLGAILYKLIANPTIIIMIVALYFSIVPHEVAHGVAANMAGDPTAKLAGRLNMNPVKHIDIVGLLLPIFMILMGAPFVIGWAKPVPVNFNFIRDKKWGIFQVAIAGVVTNIFIALLAATILKFGFAKEMVQAGTARIFQNSTEISDFFGYNFMNISYILVIFLISLILINLGLAIFNLLPIPPLDGSRILSVFASRKGKAILNDLEKYGFIILIILLWTGLLGYILNPIFSVLIELIFFRYIM